MLCRTIWPARCVASTTAISTASSGSPARSWSASSAASQNRARDNRRYRFRRDAANAARRISYPSSSAARSRCPPFRGRYRDDGRRLQSPGRQPAPLCLAPSPAWPDRRPLAKLLHLSRALEVRSQTPAEPPVPAPRGRRSTVRATPRGTNMPVRRSRPLRHDPAPPGRRSGEACVSSSTCRSGSRVSYCDAGPGVLPV